MYYNNNYINWYYPNNFYLRNVRSGYTVAELQNIIRTYPDALLVDVRSPAEYAEGHIAGAVNIPEYEINRNMYNRVPNLNVQIFVYCASGGRSANAYNKLVLLGYNNAVNLGGMHDLY